MADHYEQAKTLRLRAEECRALAKMMGTTETKAPYLRLADAYEALAQQEEILGGAPSPLLK